MDGTETVICIESAVSSPLTGSRPDFRSGGASLSVLLCWEGRMISTTHLQTYCTYSIHTRPTCLRSSPSAAHTLLLYVDAQFGYMKVDANVEIDNILAYTGFWYKARPVRRIGQDSQVSDPTSVKTGGRAILNTKYLRCRTGMRLHFKTF